MAEGSGNEARLTRETWRRLFVAIAAFATSRVRARALGLFGSLLGLLFAISALNVVNSYVGRDFMTAIERRDHAEFVRQAFLYVLVFGALTTAAVLSRFTEERFGLLWRGWLTERLVHYYLSGRTYLRVGEEGTLSNPDQRITEDVRSFVTMTVSLFLMFLNGTLTVIAFSGVLWSISRPLFLVGIVYAAVGSMLTVFLGRPLIALNYAQSDREADFRAALIDVRENAEAIAIHGRERQLELRLKEYLGALVGNLRRIIAVNRNLGFFTTGYNYMIQIIPALVVAPLFIRGEVEFGVITQSAMAFSHLLGAFSLVITQFSTISTYAAVLARLFALSSALQPPGAGAPGIDTTEDPERVAYDKLTLAAPGEPNALVRDLSFEIPRGTRVLVCSGDPAVRGALMRATAGVWDEGSGRVVRPPLHDVAFLPERPYLPPGTLREMLQTSDGTVPVDSELHGVLAILDAVDLVAFARGTDRELDFERLLSQRDQQALAIARVLISRPIFAFVDNLGETVGIDRLPTVFAAFVERGITCVTFGGHDEPREGYDSILILAADGTWVVQGGDPSREPGD
jgi:putative ATP-binding cassette transporter